MSFILSNLATILVAAVVLLVVALAVVVTLKSRKKGGSCGCGCSQCPSAGMCHPDTAAKTK